MHALFQLGFLITFGAAFAFLISTSFRVTSYHRASSPWPFVPAAKAVRVAKVAKVATVRS